MRILVRPIITEKSMAMAAISKFVFEVALDANKPQIAQIIEEIYKVEVLKVNVIRKPSEEKIVRGRFKATSKEKKRVIVTLKKGQKIEGFEVKE